MSTVGDKRVYRLTVVAVFISLSVFTIIHLTYVRRVLRLPSDNYNLLSQLLFRANKQPSVKPLCSMKLFQDIVRSRPDGVVSGNGTWIRHSNNSPDRFQPSICRLRHGVEIPAAELLQCLHSVKNIVLMGDSNVHRYYEAVVTLLQNTAGAQCNVIKYDGSEAHNIDAKYYTDQLSLVGPLIVHHRDCSGCYNEKIQCYVPTANINVTVERLVLEFTSDSEVTSLQTYWDCIEQYNNNNFSLCRVSTTSQQFLLKEYLSSTTPTADLIVVFGNSHDSMRFTLREHAMNVRTFLDMINTYQPNTTRLVWTTKPGEYSVKKPERFQGPIYETGTMDIMQWLAAANKIQFKEMRNWLINTGQPLAFLDLLTMSEPVLSDWNVDGVHMNVLWYQHAISYILQSFCVH